MARRDEGAYCSYVTEPQRSQPRCIERESDRLSHSRALGTGCLDIGAPVIAWSTKARWAARFLYYHRVKRWYVKTLGYLATLVDASCKHARLGQTRGRTPGSRLVQRIASGVRHAAVSSERSSQSSAEDERLRGSTAAWLSVARMSKVADFAGAKKEMRRSPRIRKSQRTTVLCGRAPICQTKTERHTR